MWDNCIESQTCESLKASKNWERVKKSNSNEVEWAWRHVVCIKRSRTGRWCSTWFIPSFNASLQPRCILFTHTLRISNIHQWVNCRTDIGLKPSSLMIAGVNEGREYARMNRPSVLRSMSNPRQTDLRNWLHVYSLRGMLKLIRVISLNFVLNLLHCIPIQLMQIKNSLQCRNDGDI